MADKIDFVRESEFEGGEEVYSNAVRAGRRTYFFDVKATRNDDYFITITESRKKQGKDGNFFFDKHKLYLYKEDFQKFSNGLEDVISFIKTNKPEFFADQEQGEPVLAGGMSDLDYEFDKL